MLRHGGLWAEGRRLIVCCRDFKYGLVALRSPQVKSQTSQVPNPKGLQRFLDRMPGPVKLLLVFLCLYFFMVGIRAMGDAFKMIGGGVPITAAGPLVSLFIGILATTLVQSSSVTTSVVVTAAASGTVRPESAFFIIMGANVGTTVTNTIVSLGHITHTNEYRRAFAAATVHDFFNVMVLLVLFPLQVFTNFLGYFSGKLTDIFSGFGGADFPNPIKIVTDPVKNALKDVAISISEFVSEHFFEITEGLVFLILGLLLLFTMLIGLVRCLRSLLLKRVENLFDRVIFKTPLRSLSFGLILTVLVQSSSITTSLAVPLVGVGILSVAQIVPYTMGANIGTTCTALLAAAALAGGGNAAAIIGLQVAFFHLLFNVLGVCLMWPFRWIPVAVATGFANLAVRNRIIPLLYILIMFYIVPFLIILIWR